MIRVSASAVDRAAAWRVRDALARHPLLGGAIAEIEIKAHRNTITLDGWVLDEGLLKLAAQIANRAAGAQFVVVQLRIHRGCRTNTFTPLGSSSAPAYGEETAIRPQRG